jgi:hypothetical protein
MNLTRKILAEAKRVNIPMSKKRAKKFALAKLGLVRMKTKLQIFAPPSEFMTISGNPISTLRTHATENTGRVNQAPSILYKEIVIQSGPMLMASRHQLIDLVGAIVHA